MVSSHEHNHDLCDYGTGDIVEMDVDFVQGVVEWKINNKSMVVLENEAVKKLLRLDVEWVVFIALYNVGDCVEWRVGKEGKEG